VRYFLIAGEPSGDLHGAGLTKAILQQDPDAEIVCWGGDLMARAGARVLSHYNKLAVMGLVEVIKALPRILRLLKVCQADIATFKPDVVVLIDYPGFNLRMATWAKKNGFRTCFYISPKVWAWNTKRVHRIKRDVDLMLSILPFEQDFYQQYGVPVVFVGNPLLDNVAVFKPRAGFAQQHGLGPQPVLALLPGSRRQEIKYLLEPMLVAAANLPAYQTAVAMAGALPVSVFEPYMARYPQVKWIHDATYDLVHIATTALVCSGTATLEVALLGTPQVVVYKGHPVAAWVARRLVKLPYISLVNLVAQRKVVDELLQEQVNTQDIHRAIDLLNQPEQQRLVKKGYYDISVSLGDPGVSRRAAEALCRWLKGL
jgi:lipid-A-disaccharide synthase